MKDIPVHRLEGILKTRNIQGIIVPPADRLGGWEKLKKFDWSPFAVVRFGLSFPHLKTHYVTSAQMMNTMMAFERIQQLGYKRIGFVCEYSRDRVFSVGYHWAQKQIPMEQRIPELLLDHDDTGTLQLDVFKKWLKKHQPDALITDSDDVRQMLQVLNYRVPEDIGLATTSIHDTAMDAGIDQRPYEIGRAATRILTALIAERSFGLPESCNETLVEGKWIDGSMMPPRK